MFTKSTISGEFKVGDIVLLSHRNGTTPKPFKVANVNLKHV